MAMTSFLSLEFVVEKTGKSLWIPKQMSPAAGKGIHLKA